MNAFKCETPQDFYELFAKRVLEGISSTADILLLNAKEFISRLLPKLSISDPAGQYEMSFGVDLKNNPIGEDILDLPQQIAIKKKKKVVVCIDEFQQVGEFAESDRFQKILRSHWQEQTDVAYVLYGSKKHMMERLFDNEAKPFYKFGDIIYLKRIPFAYWEAYISGKFKAEGKSISSDQIERICQTVDYHSSYVQQLCWYVYLFSDNVVTNQDIDAGIEELIDQNTALFESRTENLTPVQMRFLRALADGVCDGFSSAAVISKYKLGSSAASVATKKALLEKGLIYMEESKCLLDDPVMGLWLHR